MDKNKRKKEIKKYSKYAIKKGKQAGKSYLRTKFIVIGVLLVIIVATIATFIIPFSILMPNAPALEPINPNPDYDGTIELHWDKVQTIGGIDAENYYVYRKINDRDLKFLAKISTNTYIDSGLPSGTYTYRVEAQTDFVGFSPISNSESVTVDTEYIEPTPPEAPVLESINPSLNDDGIIHLSWSPSQDATEYWVYRSDNDGTTIRVKKTTYTYFIESLSSGNYEYSIKACNIYGVSSFSNSETVTVDLGDENLPTNPSIIINGGDTTTDSFVVTLTLSCDDANEMRFKLSYDTSWTSWEIYNTIRIVTLPENSIDNPEYRVGVMFQNENGETEVVYKDIKYVSGDNGDGNGDDVPDDAGDDYIIYLILSLTFTGFIVVIVLIRKKLKRKI